MKSFSLAELLLRRVTLLLILSSQTTSAAPPPELKGAFKNVPLQVQEFHLWWATPYQGDPGERGWSKWLWGGEVEIDRAVGPSWVRRLSSSAQPLIGAYHSSDPEVMRWQLRCAKAAGVDALHIQLYPHIASGEYYTREKAFARLLEIAAEEKMPIFAHDEVMFVKGAAQDPQKMRARIAQFLKNYGSKPGYYHVDGKPVFAFQYWNNFLSIDQLREVLHGVIQDVPGGVHFQISGGIGEQLSALDEVGSVVAFGNAHPHLKPYENRSTEIDWPRLERDIDRVVKYRALPKRKPVALLGYGGFEASSQGEEGRARWLSRGQGLSYLTDVLKRYATAKPDILILSSWNDWNENTALEPSLEVDGRGDDPYEALRLIAYLKGKEFVPPPLPNLDHIDPWMRAYHKGEDKTPPYAVNAWLSPNIGELRFSFVDETSGVGEAKIARNSTAGIVWSGGSAVAQGIINDPAPPVTKVDKWTAAPLADELKFRFEDPSHWKTDDAVWAVVVYRDLAPGRIVISYPNALPENRDPTDGWKYLPAVFHTSATGEWKVRVRRLNGFDPAKQGNWLSLVYYPEAGQWPTLPDAAAGVRPLVASFQLFRASDFSGNGFFVDGKSPGGNTVTFRTSNLAWNPTSAASVLVTASDEKGNSAFPVPIVPGFIKTPLHQPYQLDR